MFEPDHLRRSLGRGVGLLLIGAGVLGFSPPADAFCGFYVSGADTKLFNNATQVVLMREGTRTALSMQNNYEGPPSDFAMVIPVPVILQKDNVKTLPRDVFAKIDQLDSPRLVEYWEQDPCLTPSMRERDGVPRPAPASAPARLGAGGGGLGVTVEAQFTVGEYEVVILSAKDAAGLETWLKQEKYKIPEGSEPYFRPYIQKGSKFFVARVDVKKVSFDEKTKMATLSPLRFHYDSPEFNLPVRLGLVNSNGTQDLIVHILAKHQRYEVANYPNVTIPTNLDVAENAREKFGSFYTALFDQTLEKNPKAVVTEYSWDAGTCDPCPGPALNGGDLMTFGADVMPASDTAGTQAPKNIGPGRRMMPSGYVITRLHARYSKDSLGEDLVFKAASAIVGGREVRMAKPGADAKLTPELEHGSSPSEINNFQGRYAIRHPWGGPITCKEPRRGIWGGPPSDRPVTKGAGVEAAKNLAFAPRGDKLPTFLRAEIPELGVKPEGLPVSAVTPAASNLDGGMSTTAPEAADGGVSVPDKRGCSGCSTTSQAPLDAVGLFGVAALFAWLKRRRSTPPNSSAFRA